MVENFWKVLEIFICVSVDGYFGIYSVLIFFFSNDMRFGLCDLLVSVWIIWIFKFCVFFLRYLFIWIENCILKKGLN